MDKFDCTLDETGYAIADEIRDGKWDHVAGIKHCPATPCAEIIVEFMRRCPGYTDEEYRSALSKGFYDSR